MSQLREGYVQIHPDRLARLLEIAHLFVDVQTEGHVNHGILKDIHHHVRNKNQAYLNSTDPRHSANQKIFKIKSLRQKTIERRQLEARQSCYLASCVGKKIQLSWNGKDRTGVIKGRYQKNKSFILVDIEAYPTSPTYGNMTIDNTDHGVIKNARVHLSIIVREAAGNFRLIK